MDVISLEAHVQHVPGTAHLHLAALQISRREKGEHFVYGPLSKLTWKTCRQMNVDYTLCEALRTINIGGIEIVIGYYDVHCQHSKKFLARVKRNPYLQIPPCVRLVPGIGLLHVTEHKPECVPRYAPSFIKGAGLVAGEIIESLWSGLNGCASSTRTATKASRAEILDDHMNTSNWSKLLNIVETICKSYEKASKGFPAHKAEFEDRTAVAGPENVKRWGEQATKAQKNRVHKIDSMDIYLATSQKGIFFRLEYVKC